ncbi:hypothetical protein M3181_07605 [Mesobacillus maritimus]|uniref:hypothetical protein n=1 Tax=Mesobacillus maritimus TaxID=1643336 RepID=UPI00203CFDE6|nr:hypothetical protein [Mesobacillus maritimus]MCM3668867.1 hypothetical protein [Mesobacillus maritimus]
MKIEMRNENRTRKKINRCRESENKRVKVKIEYRFMKIEIRNENRTRKKINRCRESENKRGKAENRVLFYENRN